MKLAGGRFPPRRTSSTWRFIAAIASSRLSWLSLTTFGPCRTVSRQAARRSGAAPGPLRAPRRRPGDLLGALALLERDVILVALADVDLARARDLLLGIVDHLEPLRDPTGGARDREDHREHLVRDPQRLVDDPRVEVDVRVELAVGEVLVVERALLELGRDLDQRVVAGG